MSCFLLLHNTLHYPTTLPARERSEQSDVNVFMSVCGTLWVQYVVCPPFCCVFPHHIYTHKRTTACCCYHKGAKFHPDTGEVSAWLVCVYDALERSSGSLDTRASCSLAFCATRGRHWEWNGILLSVLLSVCHLREGEETKRNQAKSNQTMLRAEVVAP